MLRRLIHSCMPYMRFLFVRPGLCPPGLYPSPDIRLPSDSASRRTPLPSANAPYCQARSGLSPPSCCPCGAHKMKSKGRRPPSLRFRPLTKASQRSFFGALHGKMRDVYHLIRPFGPPSHGPAGPISLQRPLSVISRIFQSSALWQWSRITRRPASASAAPRPPARIVHRHPGSSRRRECRNSRAR